MTAHITECHATPGRRAAGALGYVGATAMTDTQAADLLAGAGRALCGPAEWQAPFAKRLGVSPRTLQRWLAGKSEPDPDVLQRAYGLLMAHRADIDRAAGAIQTFLKAA